MIQYSKKTFCIVVFAILLNASQIRAQDTTPPYDGTWEALQKMPVPAWFDDGKIGIFIHWGPYLSLIHI